MVAVSLLFGATLFRRFVEGLLSILTGRSMLKDVSYRVHFSNLNSSTSVRNGFFAHGSKW